MAHNIEIKARATDFKQQCLLAASLSDTKAEILIQEDTFFLPSTTHSTSRLKLRQFPNSAAQLIHYKRTDTKGPKLSEYHITKSDDGDGLKCVLEKAYGIRQVVKKERLLYMSGRTRLHFDTVENLGYFIELEVVLNEQDSHEDGQKEAQILMTSLNIKNDDLIDVAYIDLLEQQ